MTVSTFTTPQQAVGAMLAAGAVFAICGLDRYCRDKPTDRPWLNPATFLNQRRFEDQPAASTAAHSSTTSWAPKVDFGGGVTWPAPTILAAVDR